MDVVKARDRVHCDLGGQSKVVSPGDLKAQPRPEQLVHQRCVSVRQRVPGLERRRQELKRRHHLTELPAIDQPEVVYFKRFPGQTNSGSVNLARCITAATHRSSKKAMAAIKFVIHSTSSRLRLCTAVYCLRSA